MTEAFERDSLPWAYVKWHYGRGLKEFFAVAGNFLWFIVNFFSFKLLLKTLFAPWKRMGEGYGNTLDFGALAGSFIVNSLMRLVGFVSKVVVLSIGLISYLAVAVFSICVLSIWLLAPAILIVSLILSAVFFAV